MNISEAFPEFSKELQELLIDEGESALAEQVPTLNVLDRCRCGDDFCATMHMYKGKRSNYQPDHRNVPLHPQQGMIILDVIEGKIVTVEVLYRDLIREKLLKIVP